MRAWRDGISTKAIFMRSGATANESFCAHAWRCLPLPQALLYLHVLMYLYVQRTLVPFAGEHRLRRFLSVATAKLNRLGR